MLFKEIGHLAFRVKDYSGMQKFFKENWNLTKSFCLYNKEGEERIGYFGLPDGHFLEMFPIQQANRHGFKGDNSRERHSFQYGWLSKNEEKKLKLVEDIEQNVWKVSMEETSQIQGLTGATFYCKKFPEMKEFYRGLLEMKVAEESEQRCLFILPSGQFIELIKADYTQDNRTDDKASHHMALLTDDILKVAEKLEGQGVLLSHGSKLRNPAYTEPYRNLQKLGNDGSYAFYFSDPEDNEIETMQYTGESMQLKFGVKTDGK